MTLSEYVPQHDIDGRFHPKETVKEGRYSLLQEKGFNYAEKQGVNRTNFHWIGNLVMGDKPVKPVTKRRLDLANGSL